MGSNVINHRLTYVEHLLKGESLMKNLIFFDNKNSLKIKLTFLTLQIIKKINPNKA